MFSTRPPPPQGECPGGPFGPGAGPRAWRVPWGPWSRRVEATGRGTSSRVGCQSFLYKLPEPTCILESRQLPSGFLRWGLWDQWSAHCVCTHACVCVWEVCMHMCVCVHVHASPLPCLEGVLTEVRAGAGRGGAGSHRIWCCWHRMPELIPAEGCPSGPQEMPGSWPERVTGPSGSWSQAQRHPEAWGAAGSLRTAGSAWW